MSMSRGKKIVLSCAVLAVLAAGVFYVNARMQASAVARVLHGFTSVPAPHSVRADSVTAGLFGRVVTIRGFHGTFILGKDSYALRVREMDVKGLADIPQHGGAVLQVMDSLVIRDLALSGPGYEEKTAEYRIDDVRADIPLIKAAWRKLPPDIFSDTADDSPADSVKAKQDMKAAAEFFLALETLYLGKVWNQNSTVTQTTDFGTVSISEENGQWLEVSLRRMGAAFTHGVRVYLDGKELCTVASASVDGVVLPSLGTITAGAAQANDETAWRDIFVRQAVAVKNLQIKGLSARNGSAALASLGMVSGSFDAAIAESKALSVTGTWRYEDLVLDKAALNLLLEANIQKKEFFSDSVTLSGDGAFSLASKNEDLTDAFTTSGSLRAKGLADVNASFHLQDIPFAFESSWGKLKSASFSATDYKGSEVLMKLFAALQGKESERDMRAEIVAMLEEQAQATPPSLLPLVSACIAFVKNPGGTLNVSVAPQKALPLLEALTLIILAPEQIGISASFKPGAK